MPIEDDLVAAVGELRGIAAADRLCEACVELFPVDAAAISLVFDGANFGTFGASGSDARTYDEVQFTLGEGPCLDSVAQRAPVTAPDLASVDEHRWPAYSPVMLGHHIRGVFAVPVVVAGAYMGALDLFSGAPGALRESALAGALVAATLAEVPLLDLLGKTLELGSSDPDSEAWQELSLLTRAEVSQATGMLVAQLDVEPAEALVRLRAYAYAEGRSASEVARDIVARRLWLEPDR